jgi:NADPH:quinone reductase-like Zn-dependent oxidoreductase
VKVIDYKAHSSLYDFVSEKYGKSNLDFIFDCVGDEVLFSKSPAYLKREGKFVNIVGGKSQGVVPVLKNNFLPTFLGGTPRNYKMLGLSPSGTYAKEVMKWVEDGLIKEVPIDSEFAMEDVIQVSA